MFFDQYTPDNNQDFGGEQSPDYIETDGMQTADEIVASVLGEAVEPVSPKIDGHANIVVAGVGGGLQHGSA